VAIIGASSDDQKEKTGWVGRLIKFGFKGQIYPINPKAYTILGLKAYPSVKDVPESIDYVIMNVPRKLVLPMLQECVDKEVKVVHVYTAGFAETGDEEGEKLQEEMENIISKSKTRMIGPNCIGVYCPTGGLTFDMAPSAESGPVAFISQTGTGGRRLVYLANVRGLRFSKVVSFGNAVDLSGEDFLEHVVADPETKVILLYIEGLKYGQRFFKAVREAVKIKPVIILAAGLTEGGAGAAASHTGALAGNQQIWNAFFRQTGAIRVETFEEAIEQLIAVLNMGVIKGRRVSLVGRGGGLGVVTTDLCEREGLKVPEHSPEIKTRLSEITPAMAGSSIRNPVEIGLGRFGVSEYYAKGIQIVASDPQIDFIITFLNPEDYIQFDIGDWVEDASKQLIAVAKTLPKPMAIAFVPGHNPEILKQVIEMESRCQETGVACFSSLEAAIKATSKLAKYYEFLEG
jgi:acyl-CoA synthetase (NDP forming)